MPMPSITIYAMRRKLRGKNAHEPRLVKRRWRKDSKSKDVRYRGKKMLSALGDSDILPNRLNKAMAIGDLYLRLEARCEGPYVARFRNFSPEIDALHNRILEALTKLKTLGATELKVLKVILDPETEVADKGLKAAVKNYLIEYLFECGDMDVIPDSLDKALIYITSCVPCKRRR